MKLLIIGKTGQLAQALSAIAPDAAFLGRDALDLASPDIAAQAADALRAHAPDVVINAAAYTAVDKAESEADLAHAVNAVAPGALSRAAAGIGAAFLHISTDYVFDGAKSGEWTEDDPTSPLQVYGASKRAGELAALAANPRSSILRVSWVYAPWGANFATTMLRLAARESLNIVADQHGKPTSALDLADAMLAMAPRLASAGPDAPIWGVRHYAGAGVTNWADFADAIFARAKTAGLIETAPTVGRISAAEWPSEAERPANSALDCARFEADFGIKTIAWDAALDRVIERLASRQGAG